jgi:hypothetical protein
MPLTTTACRALSLGQEFSFELTTPSTMLPREVVWCGRQSTPIHPLSTGERSNYCYMYLMKLTQLPGIMHACGWNVAGTRRHRKRHRALCISLHELPRSNNATVI